MPIPKVCKMPNLSGLNPLIGHLVIQDVFLRKHGFSHDAKLYRRHFIRLVDKALDEYDKAREAILAQIKEAKRPTQEMVEHGRIIYMFTFVDHIENCINAVSRLYKFLERIKSEKLSPEIPREIRRLVETQAQSITDIRNTVEHMDDKIQKGEIASDKLLMLSLNDESDGVAILDFEMKFSDLGIVLKKMHEIALSLLTLKTHN
jgi:hypothetical protein